MGDHNSNVYWALIAGGVCLILFLLLLARRNFEVLRDSGPDFVKPNVGGFSLSRVQLAWWTLLVLIAFFFVWYKKGILPPITPQILGLLGISGGTRLVGNIIDSNDISTPNIKRHQLDTKDQTWFDSILSDGNGLSIHRLQNVLFTIAIGAYFLFVVFDQGKIPELDPNLVILMGISSATYLGIKQGENKASNQ